MSVRNLVEGSCGELNPLMKLAQHLTTDKSLADDGLRWHHSSPNQALGHNYLEDEFMAATLLPSQPVAQPFRMDILLQEMREIENSRSILVQAPAVADLAVNQHADAFLAAEAQNSLQPPANSSIADLEVIETPSTLHPPVALADLLPEHISLPPTLRMPFHPMPSSVMSHPVMPPPLIPFQMRHFSPWPNSMEHPMHMWPGMSEGLMPHSPAYMQEPRHLFMDATGTTLQRTTNEMLATVQDSQVKQADYVKLSDRSDLSGTIEQSEGSEQRSDAKQSEPAELIDNTKQSEASKQRGATSLSGGITNLEGLEDMKADPLKLKPWEPSEPNEADPEFLEMIHERWKTQYSGSEFWESLAEADLVTNEEMEDGAQQIKYEFSENNPLISHPDPLAEGERCLSHGDLPSAVLFFEAAAQLHDNAKAWYLLGLSHAENEQDSIAMRALLKCVSLDPSYSEAWMALAACYINEGYQIRACDALKDWLRSKEEYAALVKHKEDMQPSPLVVSLAPRGLVQVVHSLFLSAANSRSGGSIDPDVQCCFGMLHHLTGEYEKAVDCFQTALSVTPDDARLWNKLGATLANNKCPAEAVAAYERALELSPGFIRCRYNLGIACFNFKAYREAAAHLLSALNLQAAGRGLPEQCSKVAVSDSIWHTLKLCVIEAGLSGLLPAVDARDLAPLNKEFDINNE